MLDIGARFFWRVRSVLRTLFHSIVIHLRHDMTVRMGLHCQSFWIICCLSTDWVLRRVHCKHEALSRHLGVRSSMDLIFYAKSWGPERRNPWAVDHGPGWMVTFRHPVTDTHAWSDRNQKKFEHGSQKCFRPKTGKTSQNLCQRGN